MTNYLTSNPIFVLSKNDKHLTNTFLDDHLSVPSELDEKISLLYSKIEEAKKCIVKKNVLSEKMYCQKKNFIPPEFNDHWGTCLNLKTHIKSSIITILSELKLKNIEYTKRLIFVLGRYRSMCSQLIEITRDINPILEELNGWGKKTEETSAETTETTETEKEKNIPEQIYASCDE